MSEVSSNPVKRLKVKVSAKKEDAPAEVVKAVEVQKAEVVASATKKVVKKAAAEAPAATPVVKAAKVAKAPKAEAPASETTSTSAEAGETKKGSSKTNTANIDAILRVLINEFKLDEKLVKKAVESYLPFTSEFRKKGKKDPLAPKKSLSAYMYFGTDIRSDVKSGGNIPFAEITKEIGRRWKAATPEVRSKYEALAKKDTERYQREKQAYREKLGLNDVKVSRANDPEYIENPETKKMIKRTTELGKKLVAAATPSA
jgi:hypothetical protein